MKRFVKIALLAGIGVAFVWLTRPGRAPLSLEERTPASPDESEYVATEAGSGGALQGRIGFLDDPERLSWQKPDEIVKALGLTGSEVLVDIGAGSGLFTFRFAKALPQGYVIATEVDPNLVQHIQKQAAADHVMNVKATVIEPDDPSISPQADVAFACNVIVLIQDLDDWLRKGFAEMKPGSKLVLVQFEEGKFSEKAPAFLKLKKSSLIAGVKNAGFVLRADHSELLPYQFLLIFEKPFAAGGHLAN